jgi:ribosomal protein S18 acetylase RimI-like enzyme
LRGSLGLAVGTNLAVPDSAGDPPLAIELPDGRSISYPADMSAHLSIAACPTSQRAVALRVLHAGQPADQQAGLVQTLQATQPDDDQAFAGLFVASTPQGIVGATWAQLTAGNTAVVWPPDLTRSTSLGLMKALAEFLSARQVALAQFLVSPDAEVSDEVVQAGDFQKLAKLAYLHVELDSLTAARSSIRLVLQPNASADPDGFGELLQRTYVDSQDCPRLNGVRDPADILAGYREQGTFQAERWFTVQHDDRDIGALILTVHEDTGNWELVYMGLVPEARGAGLGREILEFGMWQAKQGGAERLVLAVDQSNQPALDMYQQAGFNAWDYRTVYARMTRQP